MLPNNPRLCKCPPDSQEKNSHDKNATSEKLAICGQGTNSTSETLRASDVPYEHWGPGKGWKRNRT